MNNRLLLCMTLFATQVAMAQRLQSLPNADFNRWTQAEPTGWKTNNVYDDQSKLLRTLVEPAGIAGAKLLVKRVVYRADPPELVTFAGGSLSSPLLPFMPAAEKPVRLQVRYRFTPDSADVLNADLSLDSRNNEPGTLKPDETCICRLKSLFGTGPVSLPVAITSQAVVFDAVFTSPNGVPPGCAMYVWKIRFWIGNKVTHPHERTEAIIEHVDILP